MEIERSGDGMNVIEWFATEAEARAAARQLLERGVAADVQTEPAPAELAAEGIDSQVSHDGARHGLAVQAADDVRARQLLGLPDVEPEAGDETDEMTRTVRNVLVPVLVAIVVLITVPLLAFFITFKLSGG